MKTWNQLFIRHGWNLVEKESNVFHCEMETKGNLEFLIMSLESLEIPYQMKNQKITLQIEPVAESKWLKSLDFPNRGRGGNLWFKPGQEQAKIDELDTYISGIVRQLNRLGFQTKGSCDGHDRRVPHVIVTKEKDIEQLKEILLALGLKRIYYREARESYLINLHLERIELLDLAEKMSFIEEDWLVKGIDYIKEQLFYVSLDELLSIPGESGNERQVREYVKEKLNPFVDYISTDRHGNLLAEKTYKSGNGPTILLNAHLDTVFEIEANRKIIKDGNSWSSSEGILGADDRAGVAVLLNIAESLIHSSSFSGKVKFIFTVEEESGLVGASNLDEYFLWGVDAAIVVDRCGKGDIVTSCGAYTPFCDEAYGRFFENIAVEEGLSEWLCTNGGSSDTRIWAEYGIQSVNLSAGYMNEHTADETLDIAATYETAKLIKGVFKNMRSLRNVLREIERQKHVLEITG